MLVLSFRVGEAFIVDVDGASAWSTTTRMTLPLMAPVLLVLAVRDVVVLQNTLLPART